MSRLRDTLGGMLDRTREARRRSSVRRDDAAVRLAAALYRRGDTLAARPFRGELSERPPALTLGGARIDVLEDLAAYTELPDATVEALVRRREPISFRGEWHATPDELRRDHWFYLASKTYLFANAPHFTTPQEIDRIAAHLPQGGAVLDFGGGVGNLALALVARGHTMLVDELNALQRDFVRFRVHRHGLQDRVTVLDPWAPAPRDAVDAVTAFDVLEHLPDGRGVLDDRLLPALRPGGVLVEDSPFVQTVANPMHHADWGLDRHLASQGFETVATFGAARVWRSRG